MMYLCMGCASVTLATMFAYYIKRSMDYFYFQEHGLLKREDPTYDFAVVQDYTAVAKQKKTVLNYEHDTAGMTVVKVKKTGGTRKWGFLDKVAKGLAGVMEDNTEKKAKVMGMEKKKEGEEVKNSKE